MSQQEFETYLSVLSRLLRLRPDQREQVAEELRDHLETRLEELSQRGVPREEAVRIALDEFGDAAGLAASFFSQVREQRRRWVMRLTTVSIGGLAAAVILALALWPESKPGLSPRRAIAQLGSSSGALGAPAAEPRQAAAKSVPARKPTELEEKLGRRIAVEFIDTPFGDVITFLADVSDVQFYLNKRALEEIGVTTDAPVTLRLKDVRLDTVLDLALEQVGAGLAYIERDGVLVISEASSLAGRLDVRVYDCRDLLSFAGTGGRVMEMQPGSGGGGPMGGAGPMPMGGMAGGGGGGGLFQGGLPSGFGTQHDARAQHLIQLVQHTVKPEAWDTVGGPGTVSEYGGLMVVRQNAQIQREVEKLLSMLREAAGLPEGAPAKPATPTALPGPALGLPGPDLSPPSLKGR